MGESPQVVENKVKKPFFAKFSGERSFARYVESTTYEEWGRGSIAIMLKTKDLTFKMSFSRISRQLTEKIGY